jgi:hypothetical protein
MEAVAICWYRRIGSSVESTLAAVDGVIVMGGRRGGVDQGGR